MRIISGTVKSTPTQWLSVLANIEPPHIRRQNAVLMVAEKIACNTNLSIHEYGVEKPRMKSRYLFLERVKSIKTQLRLKCNLPANGNLIKDVHSEQPGSSLPRRLSRIRTGQGRCNQLMHKWRRKEDPRCDCGAEAQTMHHIVNECGNRRFTGTLEDIHAATDEAVLWLDRLEVGNLTSTTKIIN